MKIKAVIFDMDGVLIDSENLWQQSERELFGALGIELTDALLAQSRGLRTREMVAHWCGMFNITSVSPESLIKLYDTEMIQKIRDQVPLMEGAVEAILFFKEKNIPVALASCSTMDHIKAAMEKYNLSKHFDLMVSAANGMPGKPHPQVYLQTASRLGVEPTDCLAIEDSFFGIISAKAARMKVLALPDPHEYDQERFGVADIKIRSLTEINDTLLEKLK
jgi:HAD superfamily hydrolase (TIGR01509 family)